MVPVFFSEEWVERFVRQHPLQAAAVLLSGLAMLGYVLVLVVVGP
jgi:hypothetical protein